jgi:hypothetical protein
MIRGNPLRQQYSENRLEFLIQICKIPVCIKTRACSSHQPAQRGTVVSERDVVVKNDKHGGMLSLLVRDEATGGLYGKTDQTAAQS